MIGIRNKYMDEMIYNINYLKINECIEVLGAFGVINLMYERNENDDSNENDERNENDDSNENDERNENDDKIDKSN